MCSGLFLGNSLVLLCLLFLNIQNPKSTNLAGSLAGAPIHRHFTNSKTKTLSRDRSILQHFIHTVGICCFLSIHRLQFDCDCDLRARCAAAVRSHNTTPPLRPQRGLISLGGRHMVAPEEQAQKKYFFDLDMCWLQKHNSGGNSHTEVQFMVYLSPAPHSYAVSDSATAASWRKLQKTTFPGTLHGRRTHSKAVGTLNHNIP